ncbi:MAG: hypothetical protein DMG07_29325 [Acidobacteria bacterium]|nr:MAG: hypothetical protein DMG07_29325 [Acidobacteriota bacterium]
MGRLKEHDGGILGIMMYPVIWVVAASDHGMLFRLVPIDTHRSEVEMTWLVDANAVEGVDYDPERVSWVWRVTGEQDWRLCENNQAGINSRRYRPGPYSPLEGGCVEFIRWYLERAGLEGKRS